MKSRNYGKLRLIATATALVSLAGGVALAGPMKPELAAKKEVVRKQQEQRITHEKRQAAADALKAERVKIYKAKQAARQTESGVSVNK